MQLNRYILASKRMLNACMHAKLVSTALFCSVNIRMAKSLLPAWP